MQIAHPKQDWANTRPQKQQQQKDANAEGAGPRKKKVTAAQLRVQKGMSQPHHPTAISKPQLTFTHGLDLAELEGTLGKTMKTSFPNPDDILNFTLTIEPDEGMYKGGSFQFNFAINQNFPHDPPKVKCTQKIYHPNIDLEGNVCLNILREDWKPVLNLNAVIVGLQVRTVEGRLWLDPTTHRTESHLARRLYLLMVVTHSSSSSNPTLRILLTKKQQKIYDQIGKVSRGTSGLL